MDILGGTGVACVDARGDVGVAVWGVGAGVGSRMGRTLVGGVGGVVVIVVGVVVVVVTVGGVGVDVTMGGVVTVWSVDGVDVTMGGAEIGES